MTSDSDTLEQLIRLASSSPQVQVLWLYGSRAKGTAGPTSDWDLAVAFDPVKQSGPLGVVLENRLRPELLALEWQRTLGVAEGKLSVVDINQAPIPLAFAVVAANSPLYCRDEGRRLQEEARIMSQMELGYSHRQTDISKHHAEE
ncbi:type VII toxin-antitoxin system MntA family adenylyltransferase antitoxin [Aeromonas sp. BIGb0445]|uniref:type VII toxin-antitoxin system MntA family adenylyltransferase antitoxin n=1 Tax=Aeromonas sp. BIGb0445 TaxID=2940593 RepID=UPI002167EB82|nr:nucleotidyltransferase domain-containing protein [Aeromonas sp. BIGb0445]MCS3458270.1 putative nucleotidyltransferase [Aeromonas sp. BIGb0445]